MEESLWEDLHTDLGQLEPTLYTKTQPHTVHNDLVQRYHLLELLLQCQRWTLLRYGATAFLLGIVVGLAGLTYGSYECSASTVCEQHLCHLYTWIGTSLLACALFLLCQSICFVFLMTWRYDSTFHLQDWPFFLNQNQVSDAIYGIVLSNIYMGLSGAALLTLLIVSYSWWFSASGAGATDLLDQCSAQFSTFKIFIVAASIAAMAYGYWQARIIGLSPVIMDMYRHQRQLWTKSANKRKS